MLNGLKVENYMVKNQFLIKLDDKLILQSYDSIVAVIDKDNKIILGRDWDYSTTTSKYVYMFLNEYTDINFYGVSDKRAYVNKLIQEGKIIYDKDLI